jgi:hypothetical protein
MVTATGTTVYFDPGIYAVVGAAGMFAAITRSTLSMTVVILEMTADLNLLAPALIGAFVAHLVSSEFGPSLFMAIIHERKLPYLSHDPPQELYRMTAKQIMVPKPIILGCSERVDHILAVLESSGHAAYPVVIEPCTAINAKDGAINSLAHRGEGCDNNFIGMIARSHLLIIINRRVWRAASTPFTLQDYERVSSRSMPKLGELRARLTRADLESYIDLTPWCNRSSLLVPEHSLGAQAFVLFRSMGLRHIPVINGQKHITGILSRLDLLDRVIQHRWLTLRRLEQSFVAAGGASLAQQYVDSNTAYSLVSAHALNDELLQKSRANKVLGYGKLHEERPVIKSPFSPFSPMMKLKRHGSATHHHHHSLSPVRIRPESVTRPPLKNGFVTVNASQPSERNQQLQQEHLTTEKNNQPITKNNPPPPTTLAVPSTAAIDQSISDDDDGAPEASKFHK